MGVSLWPPSEGVTIGVPFGAPFCQGAVLYWGPRKGYGSPLLGHGFRVWFQGLGFRVLGFRTLIFHGALH